MHHFGALLRGHIFNCCEKCVTVKYLGLSRSTYGWGELQSFPHSFLGLWRKKNCYSATWINLYVSFLLFIQIEILILLSLFVIYDLHTLSTWFSFYLLYLGESWLNLNIAVWFRVIQVGGACRKALTDISCTWWKTYIWWHGRRKSRQGLGWRALAWSDVSPAVTSVKWKWVCSWGRSV